MTILSSIDSTSQILRWPTPRSQEWTEGFLDRAASDSNVLAVVATGSAVRPNVRSVDFDLVVICEKPDLFYETRPIEIDLRVYAADEIDRQIGEGHDLLGWTVKFGKVCCMNETSFGRTSAMFGTGVYPSLHQSSLENELSQLTVVSSTY